ncbi:hypothetical protein MTAT_21540 [Moorella thermoacetica]|uniref:Peptidase MA-like domain-containing protein n=1 Tax=Neomoorella thermoacetica TaxID=1525 RepID=A0AAC9HKD6_NEOTH|nr:hypothetical protein [Moorella thermoacetica]AOQ25391.1 hypothetical protein Maut_02981 [Moorella thermoacetica]TYL11953.1 hypothetical protein MTAT_21540 [Moorella thermoacetica]
MFQAWWQVFLIFCLIFLVLTGGLFFSQTELPRTVTYGLMRQLIAGYTAWQTRGWASLTSTHFILRYQPGDADVAPLVLETAEAAYEPASRLLGYRPGGKLLILLYPDRASLARQFGWPASEGAMGVYWGGVVRVLSPHDWVESQDPSEVAAIFKTAGPVAHEFTHLLVDMKARGNYPRWLTEGVAQEVERRLTGFTMPGSDRAQAWYPLKDMDRGFDSLPDQSLAYRQSWLIVDFLVRERGITTLRQLLASLGEGDTLDQAFRQVLGLSLDDFERNFKKSVPLERARVSLPAG